MSETSPLKIHGEMNLLRDSGARNFLVYDPVAHDVYLFSGIGSGVPEAVWHNRYIAINIANDVVGESLIDYLREDEIQEIFTELQDSYKGEKIDGQYNYYGIWEENAYEIVQALESKIDSEVARYWDAWEWLLGASTRKELVAEILRESEDVWVERIVGDARLENVFLDRNDVAKLCEDLLQEVIDNGPW
jgi:hypothetical protein